MSLGYFVLVVLVKGGVLEPSRYVSKAHLAIGLAGFFLWELVLANMRLALDVATPRFQMTPGILADSARRDARFGDSPAGHAD